MKSTLKVCLIGVGRTGQEIAKTIFEQEDMNLVMAVCRPQSEKNGMPLGDLLHLNDHNVVIRGADSLEENLKTYQPDVAIDFSQPEATLVNAAILSRNHVPMAIATTGFSDDQIESLKTMSQTYETGILHAPNITLGVNVLMVLTNLAASILESYDCTIVESHFKEKKDAPSGTAKKIAIEALKGQSYYNPNIDYTDYTNIPVHAIRAGGIVGRHEVLLAGKHDKIEIIHESFSRRVFALGAIKAAKFITDKKGFYTMHDALDLNQVIARYMELSMPS